MSSAPQLPRGSRIWPRLSIVIIAGVGLYYGYVALNTWGLPNQTGVATVLDKVYYAPGTTYQTLRIGGRAFVRPYQTAEAYVLKLRLSGQETPAVVEKGLYETVNTNAEVQVVYQLTRITKVLQVMQVSIGDKKGEN
jgi:hypothetical protein